MSNDIFRKYLQNRQEVEGNLPSFPLSDNQEKHIQESTTKYSLVPFKVPYIPKYFTLSELTYSSTAAQRVINNQPDFSAVNNLLTLCYWILDPLREWFGSPITINSGFRCRVLNDAVHGSKHSQHILGQAVDITASSKEDNRRIFEYIRDNLPFDQLINEHDFSWIHVSYSVSHNRKEVLAL